MNEFEGKVAVVTGAASGIGRGIATRCAQEGLKVVLADIEQAALIQTESELKAAGASVLSVVTDVSKASDVESLAKRTLDAFGAVHLLFNNAGVAITGPDIWEYTVADWAWMMGVNLWGVIHGIRVFVPVMLEQDTECHIVNTASGAGLWSPPGYGVYSVTKHGVVTLSETLHHELAQKGARVKVSVLCPGLVNTNIINAARNRPGAWQNDPRQEAERERKYESLRREARQAMQAAMSPAQVADFVLEAIRGEKFYIFTHPSVKDSVRMRMEDIVQERSPTNPWA